MLILPIYYFRALGTGMSFVLILFIYIFWIGNILGSSLRNTMEFIIVLPFVLLIVIKILGEK